MAEFKYENFLRYSELKNTGRFRVDSMTDKERVLLSLGGRSVDRQPVAVLYSYLYYLDHFAELTGLEQWELHKWCISKPEEYLKIYKIIHKKVPFEILECMSAPSRIEGENIEIIKKDSQIYLHNKKSDTYELIKAKLQGQHATDSQANEKQYVFNKEDVNKIVQITKAEEIINSGALDYVQTITHEFGNDHFILTLNLVGILWECLHYLGQTNMLCMLIDNPNLIEYLSKKLLEVQIERIRAYCSVGSGAIFIDDGMAHSDVISVKHYERFSLPYLKEMIKEIHRFGYKVILIYFGGVSDRLEQIVSSSADALLVETSMKHYINDIERIVEKIGSRISIFGNIDPIGVLQNGTDELLEAEIERQVVAGKKARGFIISTGSPITPATSLSRVQNFIKIGKEIRV